MPPLPPAANQPTYGEGKHTNSNRTANQAGTGHSILNEVWSSRSEEGGSRAGVFAVVG